MVACLLVLVYASFGSLPAGLAYFRGERVAIQPRLVEVGAAQTGDTRTVELELSNWTDHPVRLIGGSADCSCSVLEDLPLTIPAGDSASVSLRINFSGRPGNFTRQAYFVVDDNGFQKINFSFTGRIMKPAPTGE